MSNQTACRGDYRARRFEDKLDAQAVFSPINTRAKRIRFANAGGSYFPTERAAIDAIGVRQQTALMTALLLAKLLGSDKEAPFVHLWHLPATTDRLFGFRIDTDFASDQEINDLYQLCRKYDIPATWFVEVKSRKNNLGIFKNMEGQEIAYHCFRHKLLHSRSDMSRDMLEGLRYMKLAGLKPRGYAAPYGEWRPFLSELLRDYGFEYSSEFGLAYDAMPFYPPGEDIQSLPPQIPIHPISVNRLKHAHHSPSQMTAYYLNVLYHNGRRNIPTFLYHHPGQGHLQVWEAIFRNVREKNIPVMSMGDYATWWKRRSELMWSAEWIDGKLKLHSNEPADDIRVCAHWPEGRTELHSFNPEITPVAIDYKFRIKMAGKELHPEKDPELNRYTMRMLRHDLFWHYGRLKQ
ncbi:MAG: polysaccharide deacetylase family protein [Calditrichia bacterium]